MINIGLTTWSEHQTLLNKPKLTLPEYASKLPVVEIDTPFYGIPRQSTVEKWVAETPPDFQFIVKAHQTMTLHASWEDSFSSEKELYETYLKALKPLIDAQKLTAILCQFPAQFGCNEPNILYLKRLRKIFAGLPIAIEFRHSSWYEGQHLKGMLSFMKAQNFILMIVDEPQNQGKSIPFYPIVTHSQQAIFRLHGRNQAGWSAKGEDWRKKRTLYRYNEVELQSLAEAVTKIAGVTRQTTVIFNNNSGGDAAANALTLKELLGINYQGLHPEQIDLF